MDLSAGLTQDLAALGEATNLDQQAALAHLGHGLEVAIASYLGLSITLVTFGCPVTFTVTQPHSDGTEVRASLHFPLLLLTASDPASSLTVYASAAGAFVELAADIGWLSATGAAQLRLDEHLVLPPTDAPSTLADFSALNQAVGVLIAAGFDLQDAYAELTGRAERAGVTRAAIARQILQARSGQA